MGTSRPLPIQDINNREHDFTAEARKVVGASTNAESGDNELKTSLIGHVCTQNSTTTNLGNGGVFTGEWQDTLEYGVIVVGIKSDQNSATDGLKVEWSADGTNIAQDDTFTILANIGKVFTFGPANRYVRIKYTNGVTPTTSFNIQTILRRVYVKPSSHRINDAIVGQDDAELVKAVLTGENPAGTFVNFQSTTAGNFKVSLEEFESGVSSNSNSQLNVTSFHADGTEGNLISGVNYVAGKSGVDSSTESLICIDYAHHEIHSGSHFFTGNYVDLSNGQVYDILLTTPDTTKYAHLIFEISTEAEAMFQFYENVTASNNGTPFSMFDRNRVTANTPSVTFYHSPTVTNVGTLIGQGIFGSGNKVGGQQRDSNEFVLKRNTKYMLRVTNNTALANWYDYFFDWYEHTDKN